MSEEQEKSNEIVVEKELATEFDLPIKAVQDPQSKEWTASMPDGETTWKAVGATPLESIRNLTKVIELDGIKDERLKVKRYMELNFDNAKALCLQIIEVLGPIECKNWFTVYQLIVKTGQPKEVLNKKLSLLNQYGLLSPDKASGPGLRWKIVDNRDLQITILNDKKESLQKEIELIDFQLNKLLLNDKSDTTSKSE